MDGKKSIPPIDGPPLLTEQELRDTIQHLAVQNMHLYSASKRAETRLDQLFAKEESVKSEVCIQTDNVFASPIAGSSSVEAPELLYDLSSSQNDYYEEVNSSEPYEEREKGNKVEMEKFKEDLNRRRAARHKAISAVSSELERLRKELIAEKITRENCEKQLKEAREQSVSNAKQKELLEELARIKQELAEEKAKNEGASLENKRLVDEKEDLTNNLKEETLHFEQDRAFSERRIGALKDVADLSKQMLAIRENQVSDLKTKIKNLEAMPRESAANLQLQEDYNTQISNIKSLKILYEDRMKTLNAEKGKIEKESEDKSVEISALLNKCSEFEQRIAEVESTMSEKEELNVSLQTRLDMSLEESKNLSKEIALINNMLTQMLVGNSSSDLDLDKLTKILQENHDLITEMTTKDDGTDAATSLPKLLWDLLNQIDNDESTTAGIASTSTENDSSTDVGNGDISSASQDESKCVTEETTNGIAIEEIASNLPKVWKVLTELLSHHVAPTPSEDVKSSCYKCIDTPTGPKFVPSVSNTYIRLKDLILEKKSLQKDLGKLKQLNGHLESKLHEQEQRLICVSAELTKTWGVVGRLRSQFKQLHTHEQILRYELQHKRKLLTELKKELEYCRVTWDLARQKEKETEIEWQKLRQEFADRKLHDSSSRESGYGDEKEVESSEDDGSSRNSVESQTNCSSENSEALIVISGDNSPSQEHDTTICSENSVPYELADVSWFTHMKLQSLFNSRFQTECDKLKEVQSLESIFSLPSIQIPESIRKQLEEKSSTNTVASTEETSTPVQTSPPPELSGPSVCKNDGQIRDALGRTPEQALAARAARLKRLEEQTQLLYKKVTRTTNLSVALSNRLEELHEQYGVPNPPPLPPTLPAIRIPVETTSRISTITPETSCTASVRVDVPIPPPLPEILPALRIPTSCVPNPTPTQSTQEGEDKQ